MLVCLTLYIVWMGNVCVLTSLTLYIACVCWGVWHVGIHIIHLNTTETANTDCNNNKNTLYIKKQIRNHVPFLSHVSQLLAVVTIPVALRNVLQPHTICMKPLITLCVVIGW